jgi:acetaldehyde dehydrogenase (acetylating)
LATGGTGLVRAAYGSGKPAYGVGPGNVPAFIERTADVRKAVADILAGKTFDYGTICSSEQAMVVDETVRDLALEECRRQGAYFLSPEEMEKVGRLVIQTGTQTANPKIVGRAATVIAELAGIHVPPGTRTLIARLEASQVGREFPLSAEKLSPILAFYAVPNLAAGVDLCRRLLEFGGLGHTCAIHSQSRAAVLQFGQAVPAFRVVVNTSAVHGSIGYSTNLFPAMTLGCGAPGGNITSDNIGPQHLMNIKRIAWESRAVEHRTIPAEQRLGGRNPILAPPAVSATPTSVGSRQAAPVSSGERAPATSAPDFAASPNVPEGPSAPASPASTDRTAIARVVGQFLEAQGIARGSGVSAPMQKPAPAAKPLPSPAEVAAEIAGRFFGPTVSAKEAVAAVPPAPSPNPTKTEAPAKPAIQISSFVSENDVRRAMTRSEKIFIGPKTILTPSARDLGLEHAVFVETEAGSIR